MYSVIICKLPVTVSKVLGFIGNRKKNVQDVSKIRFVRNALL